MPLKKKHTARNAIIIWSVIIIMAVLMLVSFSPLQHVTEIVLSQ